MKKTRFRHFLVILLYLSVLQITSVYANEIDFEAETYTYTPPPRPSSPQYSASSVIIMDAATGLVLYGTNEHTQHYPASITKIMTALVVLEQIYDLTERIEFSHRAIWSIPRYSAHIAMDEGETLTVYQALHGMMLPSANEVSIALAEHVSGSVENFVDLMNRRAANLGANNTRFINPSGLPGPQGEGVTTAYDMALIMREAVRHPVFVDIISALRFDIPPTERQPLTRELLNTNRLIQPGPFFNEYVVGSKTGFTNAARHTLVTYAQQDGRRLIVSVLQGESPGTFTDTTSLLAYGFNLPFERVSILDTDYTISVPVMQAINGQPTEIGRVKLQPQNAVNFNLPIGFNPSWLRHELSVPETLVAPVYAGRAHGHVSVYVQNMRVESVRLYAQNYVLPYIPSEMQEGGGAMVYIAQAAADYLGAVYAYAHNYYSEFWARELLFTLVIPLSLSAATLIISLIVYLVRRRRRRMYHKMLHSRYARYPHHYKYR